MAKCGRVRDGIPAHSQLLELLERTEHAQGGVEFACGLRPYEPVLRDVELAQRACHCLELSPIPMDLVALQVQRLQLRQLLERRDRDQSIGCEVEVRQLWQPQDQAAAYLQ